MTHKTRCLVEPVVHVRSAADNESVVLTEPFGRVRVRERNVQPALHQPFGNALSDSTGSAMAVGVCDEDLHGASRRIRGPVDGCLWLVSVKELVCLTFLPSGVKERVLEKNRNGVGGEADSPPDGWECNPPERRTDDPVQYY